MHKTNSKLKIIKLHIMIIVQIISTLKIFKAPVENLIVSK